jgi:hypothetical protein
MEENFHTYSKRSIFASRRGAFGPMQYTTILAVLSTLHKRLLLMMPSPHPHRPPTLDSSQQTPIKTLSDNIPETVSTSEYQSI